MHVYTGSIDQPIPMGHSPQLEIFALVSDIWWAEDNFSFNSCKNIKF